VSLSLLSFPLVGLPCLFLVQALKAEQQEETLQYETLQEETLQYRFLKLKECLHYLRHY